jgi:hypothetical protein
MNSHHHHDGSHRWLLLIPAALLISRAMRHGRQHRAWMAGGVGGDPAAGFRLPPKIESTLNAWHEQAHRGEPVTAAPPA